MLARIIFYGRLFVLLATIPVLIVMYDAASQTLNYCTATKLGLFPALWWIYIYSGPLIAVLLVVYVFAGLGLSLSPLRRHWVDEPQFSQLGELLFGLAVICMLLMVALPLQLIIPTGS